MSIFEENKRIGSLRIRDASVADGGSLDVDLRLILSIQDRLHQSRNVDSTVRLSSHVEIVVLVLREFVEEGDQCLPVLASRLEKGEVRLTRTRERYLVISSLKVSIGGERIADSSW